MRRDLWPLAMPFAIFFVIFWGGFTPTVPGGTPWYTLFYFFVAGGIPPQYPGILGTPGYAWGTHVSAQGSPRCKVGKLVGEGLPCLVHYTFINYKTHCSESPLSTPLQPHHHPDMEFVKKFTQARFFRWKFYPKERKLWQMPNRDKIVQNMIIQ